MGSTLLCLTFDGCASTPSSGPARMPLHGLLRMAGRALKEIHLQAMALAPGKSHHIQFCPAKFIMLSVVMHAGPTRPMYICPCFSPSRVT